MLPAFLSLSGEALTSEERSLFEAADPAGYVLFARNCRDRVQLRALTDSLRALCGRADVPILIDQEGGRIARLKPPEWPAFPAAERFGVLYDKAPISAIEAARVNALALALVLAEAGISVDCAPSLDLRVAGAHSIIGDRALSGEPLAVAALGRAVLDGLAAGGVVGVIKHVPGHGRAVVDSHVELPVVDADEDALARDLAPFRALRGAPMAMTAHVLYRIWDPARCATLSPVVIGAIIRGRIGFDGLLMSDDIGMAALKGPLGERAQAALDAGCDVVLHCSGRIDDSREIAAALDPIGDRAAMRLDNAMARRIAPDPDLDGDALAAKRDALLAYA